MSARKNQEAWIKFLDIVHFDKNFEMLQSRFPNLRLTDSAKELYKEFLFVNFDANILNKAINSAFIHCDTFPSPKQLQDIAQKISNNASDFVDYQANTLESEND